MALYKNNNDWRTYTKIISNDVSMSEVIDNFIRHTNINIGNIIDVKITTISEFRVRIDIFYTYVYKG